MPQATVRTYDSLTKTGSLLADDGETAWELDASALDGSMFRFLRPGQRVTFDLVDEDGESKARNLRIGIV
ncbi:MAG: cold-shock protein [Actinobacteria bacterium]|nr:cold-shock protein [Actinomycetota bacterium]